MNIKVDAKSDKHWEVTVVGEDRAIANMVVAQLHENPDVEFAACVVEHPVVSEGPKIVVRTKAKKAKAALVKAIEAAAEEASEFKAKVKRIREKEK
ncbi:MAG: RpoL/Rpb11 RNA polymerase subunit family protein [Candidatus ainarchaeum sp.]|nr:RpoL/Rpb11 RNA polymerase subunit family protein [Candidatus ainarchaeum sp.]